MLSLLPERFRDCVFRQWSWHRAKSKFNGVADWRIHDLRRTAATGMAELGVQPHIIEAILNHYSGYRSGVAGVYNRARYLEEMRSALEKWAAHIGGLVG